MRENEQWKNATLRELTCGTEWGGGGVRGGCVGGGGKRLELFVPGYVSMGIYYPPEVCSMMYCRLGVFREEYVRLVTK